MQSLLELIFKTSKQGQGGYDKPQTAERYIREYGADVLRLWIASQDFRNDTIVSDERRIRRHDPGADHRLQKTPCATGDGIRHRV